jgi:nuclear transport factor 2 (NTF2) superfamily protein
MDAPRPPLPPFTIEAAIEKVCLAEDGWNGRDPQKVALTYTLDSQWRNRTARRCPRQPRCRRDLQPCHAITGLDDTERQQRRAQ